MTATDLHARLLVAHAADDRGALVALYAEAADIAPDADQSAFFLTHAWIFALEADDPRAADFHATLAAAGRAD